MEDNRTESQKKMDNIVEKLNLAKGFVLGISTMAQHQQKEFSREIFEIQQGISTATRQSLEIYWELEDLKKDRR